MGLVRTIGPTVEPITLAEVKEYARVTASDDDDTITRLVAVARDYVERIAGRSLLDQTWALSLDAFPAGAGAIELAMPPVSAITSVTYTDTDGAGQTVSGSDYELDSTAWVPSIRPVYGGSWPGARLEPGSVVVTYVAGYGSASSDIPEHLRQAVFLIVNHWFEERQVLTNAGAISLSRDVGLSVSSLLNIDRVLEVV